MKISIVIPAFNEEASIAAAIDAALAQDYPDFEVIVVDNASTDNTARVARATSKAKVVHESKKGTSAARERGRRESSGEIIAMMDADCLPEKDWLTKGSALFTNKQIVAASGPYDYYDASPAFRAASLAVQKFIYRPVNAILQLFRSGGTMVGGNSFFRASALEKIGGFDTDIVFYGDETDAARKLAKVGRIVVSSSLTMKTSARRFKAEGTFTIFVKYVFFFFREFFRPGKGR